MPAEEREARTAVRASAWARASDGVGVVGEAEVGGGDDVEEVGAVVDSEDIEVEFGFDEDMATDI